MQSLRKGNEVNGVYGVAKLTSVEEGTVFLTGVEFGTESFQAVVDTGSSPAARLGRTIQLTQVLKVAVTLG